MKERECYVIGINGEKHAAVFRGDNIVLVNGLQHVPTQGKSISGIQMSKAMKIKQIKDMAIESLFVLSGFLLICVLSLVLAKWFAYVYDSGGLYVLAGTIAAMLLTFTMLQLLQTFKGD
jgi:hypothetical protein